MESKYSIEAMERIVERDKMDLQGNKNFLIFSGILATFSTATILGRGIHLIKKPISFSSKMTNKGIAQNILAVIDIGTSFVLLVGASKLLKWNISCLKSSIRNLKLEKEWLKRDRRLLEQARLEQAEERVYQKLPTK